VSIFPRGEGTPPTSAKSNGGHRPPLQESGFIRADSREFAGDGLGGLRYNRAFTPK
jgi:hypothetical protein